jgi:MFS transporter, FHS family, L-fucose permease
MAAFIPKVPAQKPTEPQGSYAFALSILTFLFCMWGFITCLNDILIPHLKAVFSLNYAQSMLIQLCFFAAYLIMSLPSGAVIEKIGKGSAPGSWWRPSGASPFIPPQNCAPTRFSSPPSLSLPRGLPFCRWQPTLTLRY